jgi:prepilin-type N-terminal cleavage/methylation domain-containing protein/prepilin-type processing-associated H-X9-DG protein
MVSYDLGSVLRRCPNSRSRAGFTLIELLVVIAIIAILAAILFPVFSRARESGRRASCMSNEKQIGLAFAMYSDDNQAFYPPSAAQIGGKWTSWDTMIFSYVKAEKVFRCPSDGVRRAAGQKPRSYAMNDQRALKDNAYGRGMKVSEIPGGASQWVLMTEWHIAGNVLGATNYQDDHEPPAQDHYVHNGGEGLNFLFYDGHVQYYIYGRLNAADNYTFYTLLP